ncbi:glycosyltransferase family 2 protein [Aquirufa rosea]|uniref:glycosyltransferase family 2 protein n=1 Tax=Aquirufa rosea TaxID=2509241 RepID=UPI0013E96237|nr:glycosyltransferase family 2 protein [Aquirufa rosea]
MKISIALCTRNGEKFLRTQLSSFVDQTLQADEIIVCDEGSTDQTLSILEQFAEKLPLKIYKNPQQLGTYRNFEKAISLCHGDIIFPADQDDYWVPQKLERVYTYFKLHPEIDAIFTDALLVDEFGQTSGKKLWESFRFRQKQQEDWKKGKSLEILLDGNRVTGCTMGIRKSYFERVSPFPDSLPSSFLHDAWLGIMAAAENKIDFIPATYVHYRLHSEQQVGVKGIAGKPPTLVDRISRPHAEKVAPYLKTWNFLCQVREAMLDTNPKLSLEALHTKIEYLDRRAHLPETRWKRLKPTLLNLLSGYYHRFKDMDSEPLAPYLMFLGDLLE